MIDVPVVKKAHAILKHAQACELDVETIREKWKGQEPE
jgi:citrate lyase subunit beta-like protein